MRDVVFESNVEVIKELEGGMLYHKERCCTSIRTAGAVKTTDDRATEQWFASIDGFRKRGSSSYR